MCSVANVPGARYSHPACFSPVNDERIKMMMCGVRGIKTYEWECFIPCSVVHIVEFTQKDVHPAVTLLVL